MIIAASLVLAKRGIRIPRRHWHFWNKLKCA